MKKLLLTLALFILIVSTSFALTACDETPTGDISTQIETSQSDSIISVQSESDVSSSESMTYQIRFNLNGGSSPSYVESKNVTELNKTDFFFDVQKEGFNFRGWSYNGVKVFDESGNIIENVDLNPSMTFVALWANQAKLTIVMNISEAGDISEGGEYEYNTEVDVFAHPHQGYEFVGWIYNEIVLSKQEEYNYKMWDKDVTITAKFRLADFKLSLNVNNEDKGLVIINPTGTITDLYESEKEGSIQYTKKTTISAYTKTETRFLGWFDEDGALVTTNAVYVFEMPNYDYNLTAKWNYFTITYDLNGGTNDIQNPTSYDTDMANIKLNNPTKSDVIFIGWQYNGQTITEINTRLGENIMLEAIWSKSSYTITYDYDGGSAINDFSYAVSNGYTLKSPTRSGCEFIGWTGSNGTTPQINVTIMAGSTGDKSYKANWKKIEGFYYIRTTITTYNYSIKYYNSDTDYIWKDAVYDSYIRSGRYTYYYYKIEKEAMYDNFNVYAYTSGQSQGQSSTYAAKADGMTQNDSYDTLAITINGNNIATSWTNYGTTE